MTEEELKIQITLGSLDIVLYAKTFIQRLLIKEDNTCLNELKKIPNNILIKLYEMLVDEMQNINCSSAEFNCADVFQSILDDEVKRRVKKYKGKKKHK